MTDGEESIERVPCGDDMCTGVVGDDGRCGTCGREGAPRAVVEDRQADSPPVGEDRESEGVSRQADPGDPDERVLCGDDMCTGIVGAEGRCGTCGRG